MNGAFWLRIKTWVLLIAFLGGVACSAEEHFQFFRLRGLRMSLEVGISEVELLSLIPDKEKRNWLLFWLHAKHMANYLESMYPLRTRISFAGWGFFEWKCRPLVPWFVLRWQGKEWYVDEEGLLWATDLPENNIVKGIRRPSGPALLWGDEMPSPQAVVPEGRQIFRSRLPLGMLESWKKTLQLIGWFPLLEEWAVHKRSGIEIVTLRMTLDGRRILLMVDGRDRRWEGLKGAVDVIVRDLTPQQDAVYLIDATYDDKIVVRKNYE